MPGGDAGFMACDWKELLVCFCHSLPARQACMSGSKAVAQLDTMTYHLPFATYVKLRLRLMIVFRQQWAVGIGHAWAVWLKHNPVIPQPGVPAFLSCPCSFCPVAGHKHRPNGSTAQD